MNLTREQKGKLPISSMLWPSKDSIFVFSNKKREKGLNFPNKTSKLHGEKMRILQSALLLFPFC